ncbi:hypothetical protein AGDE_14970 [Angomonas deanei]|uniref:Uncharacterized protein n=1 Tax=Angomonas deanei TaxID=59799 RepID=A0A7G2C7T4_9TRYP|nr:hypothetical protein AGDE_14970 [Angomonas deanei]CAD2215806.1 hypothetical protein, conserved [Angomonas deanei]|eukprot:EPY19910.1 hypothetical protein AGDE_14970 [Angomonas deanei]
MSGKSKKIVPPILDVTDGEPQKRCIETPKYGSVSPEFVPIRPRAQSALVFPSITGNPTTSPPALPPFRGESLVSAPPEKEETVLPKIGFCRSRSGSRRRSDAFAPAEGTRRVSFNVNETSTTVGNDANQSSSALLVSELNKRTNLWGKRYIKIRPQIERALFIAKFAKDYSTAVKVLTRLQRGLDKQGHAELKARFAPVISEAMKEVMDLWAAESGEEDLPPQRNHSSSVSASTHRRESLDQIVHPLILAKLHHPERAESSELPPPSVADSDFLTLASSSPDTDNDVITFYEDFQESGAVRHPSHSTTHHTKPNVKMNYLSLDTSWFVSSRWEDERLGPTPHGPFQLDQIPSLYKPRNTPDRFDSNTREKIEDGEQSVSLYTFDTQRPPRPQVASASRED